METRSAKRKKLWFADDDAECATDRITDLPDAVLYHILNFLPIKTVAQTSILSKRWRSLWSSVPDLDFTSINLVGFSQLSLKLNGAKRSNSVSHNRGTDFIAQVLALRNKSSDLRVLRFRAALSFSGLNGLIRCAIRQNVQELDVEVATDDYFNFPRSVISSESLRVFKLKSQDPGFRLPPQSVMRGGFRSLHTLSLSLVNLDDQPSLLDLFTDSSFPRLRNLSLDDCFGLKNLKINCRMLQDLTLKNITDLHGLNVSGYKLETLRVGSCFDAYSDKSWVKVDAPSLRCIIWEYNAVTATVCLQNLASLHEASIGLLVLHESLNAAKLHSVSTLLSGLSHAHCLTFESQCIEILSNKNYMTHGLLPFDNLKSLELHTGFNKHNVFGLACLFRSCPMLQTLIIKIINDYKIERRKWNKDLWDMPISEEEQFWESQTEKLKSFLNHLHVVKIHGFVECENEVSLAKYLLKHGKALQEMTLCSGQCNHRDSLRRQKIRSRMMGFSRASSNAKIAFL